MCGNGARISFVVLVTMLKETQKVPLMVGTVYFGVVAFTTEPGVVAYLIVATSDRTLETAISVSVSVCYRSSKFISKEHVNYK